MCSNKKIKDSASFAINPQVIDVIPAALFLTTKHPPSSETPA